MRNWLFRRAMRLLYLLWLNVPPARPLADKAMTRVFDAAAQQWDTYNTDPGRLDPLYAAIDRLDAAPQRALDMGCGNGTVPIWLAERYPGAWTFGIDVSPATIEEATRRAAAAGSASRFTVAHNQNCGFDDEELELVTLVNLPPPFAEIARVLATGGHVVVVFTQGPATWFYSAPARLKRGFEKAGLATLEHGGRGRGEFFIAAKR